MTSPETGANLTATTSNENSPSLFEILSQENLAIGLQAAFDHLVKVLAYQQPHNFGWLFRNSDEVFLIFNSAIQFHYLKTRGGTLSESFYGIRRTYGSETSPSVFNKFKQSLALVVLLPYARRKLDKYIEQLNERYETISSDSNNKKYGLLSIRIYKSVISISNIIRFYYYLMYALGRQRSHSILFAFLGWKLIYSSHETQSELLQQPGESLLKRTLFTLGESVLPILEFGSFMAQFINWWRIEKQREINVLPIPKPFDGHYNLEKNICPLCNGVRKNNTALKTSGIVYCYGCISKYLRQEHKCPVSGIPSSMEHLVRIYE